MSEEIEQLRKQTLDTILEKGYAIQYVPAESAGLLGRGCPYGYTVGRSMYGRPEILIAGLSVDDTTRLLHAAVDYDQANVLVEGDQATLASMPVVVVEANPAMCHGAMLEFVIPRAIQLVWAGPGSDRQVVHQREVPASSIWDQDNPYNGLEEPVEPRPRGAALMEDDQFNLLFRYPADARKGPGFEDNDVAAARAIGDGEAVLLEHVYRLPLGPGDRIAYDITCTATAVLEVAPRYIYAIEFFLPPFVEFGELPQETDPYAAAVQDFLANLPADADVTELTAYTARVSSPQALTTELDAKCVKAVELIRTPDLTHVDLEVAVRNAGFGSIEDIENGTTWEGPWA